MCDTMSHSNLIKRVSCVSVWQTFNTVRSETVALHFLAHPVQECPDKLPVLKWPAGHSSWKYTENSNKKFTTIYRNTSGRKCNAGELWRESAICI